MTDSIAERLSDAEEAELQRRLWELMKKQTARFTAFDSSSVPVDAARELFTSVCFTLEAYLDAMKLSRRDLLDGVLWEKLAAGRNALEAEVERGKKLWLHACNSVPQVQSASYADTLKSLGEFFGRYDLYYFAHQIPCDIDYQLCIPVPEELAGITYVNCYLERLTAENMVLGRFDAEKVRLLEEACYGDYKTSILNLCEPVLVNALALCMSGRDPKGLSVSSGVGKMIMSTMEPAPEATGRKLLAMAAEMLCKELWLDKKAQRDLVMTAAQRLYPRLHEAIDGGSLEKVFFEF